jgi:hypothetical protein
LAQQLRERINKWDYMKLKSFAQQKKWCLNWRGYPQNGGKSLSATHQTRQITKKHMKNCLPSLVINEMQIKITLRFHLTPVRIAIIKNTTTNKCWRGCGDKSILICCWWECQLVQPLWKTVLRIFKNLKIDLP